MDGRRSASLRKSAKTDRREEIDRESRILRVVTREQAREILGQRSRQEEASASISVSLCGWLTDR